MYAPPFQDIYGPRPVHRYDYLLDILLLTARVSSDEELEWLLVRSADWLGMVRLKCREWCRELFSAGLFYRRPGAPGAAPRGMWPAGLRSAFIW